MGFIGRDEDDGRPARMYRGKPRPLGVLTEWSCPSCGQKVEGRQYEQGCPFCGVGVPGSQPTPAPQPTPEPRAEALPGHAPIAPRSAEVQETRPARKPGELRQVATVVTRIVQYVCNPGQEAALEKTLRHALVGRYGFAWGTITAAIVDDLSPRQQDILGLASRQPGVWLGGPETPMPVEAATQIYEAVTRRHQPRAPEFVSSLRQEVEKQRMTEPIVPDTGPAFTRMDGEMARVILQACGVKVAYTLAVALQMIEDVDDPKILGSADARALANAIIQLIPPEYLEEAQEQPPAPTPEQAQAQDTAREAARERVRQVQAGSVPVATFRDVPSGEGPVR